MRIPFSTLQLKKIASVGAVFLGGNMVLMYYLLHKRFHQSPYFVEASKVILTNKALVDYLGEPVRFGNPDLSDNENNYSTEAEAVFQVPLKGSKSKGVMKFSAIKNPDLVDNMELISDEKVSRQPYWKLKNLEVIMDNRPNEKVVLVRS